MASLYAVSAPVFARTAANLCGVLAKGEAWAKAKGVEESVLLSTRLTPDMFPLVRQAQSVCNMSRLGMARLAGVEPPRFADDETTFAALIDRLGKTAAFLNGLAPASVDGKEEAVLEFKMGPAGRQRDFRFTGQDYVLQWIMPNVYFHASMAYAILRQTGVEIGKGDFLGG